MRIRPCWQPLRWLRDSRLACFTFHFWSVKTFQLAILWCVWTVKKTILKLNEIFFNFKNDFLPFFFKSTKKVYSDDKNLLKKGACWFYINIVIKTTLWRSFDEREWVRERDTERSNFFIWVTLQSYQNIVEKIQTNNSGNHVRRSHMIIKINELICEFRLVLDVENAENIFYSFPK